VAMPTRALNSAITTLCILTIVCDESRDCNVAGKALIHFLSLLLVGWWFTSNVINPFQGDI